MKIIFYVKTCMADVFGENEVSLASKTPHPTKANNVITSFIILFVRSNYSESCEVWGGGAAEINDLSC
jgi:hypothetical protein